MLLLRRSRASHTAARTHCTAGEVSNRSSAGAVMGLAVGAGTAPETVLSAPSPQPLPFDHGLITPEDADTSSAIRMSAKIFPNSQGTMEQIGVPAGAMITPFVPLRPPPPLLRRLPTNCTVCSAYMSPSCTVDYDSGYWTCCMCQHENRSMAEELRNLGDFSEFPVRKPDRSRFHPPPSRASLTHGGPTSRGAQELVSPTVEYIQRPARAGVSLSLATGPGRASFSPQPVVFIVDGNLSSHLLTGMARQLRMVLREVHEVRGGSRHVVRLRLTRGAPARRIPR